MLKKLLSLLMCLALLTGVSGVWAEGASGTFTGEAEGFKAGEMVTVTVTLVDGVITEVTALAPEDTPEIAGPALEELVSRVLAANSAEVEVVAGATWTSKGFIAALEAALAQTGDAGDTAGEAGVSGTFTGEAEGFKAGEMVTVTVTLVDGVITEVTAQAPEDTPEIAGPALEELASRVLAANSAEVEVVAGATWTSKGFIAALKAALAQAGPDEEPAGVSGTFTGEAEGFKAGEMVTVTVTLVDGVITEVTALAPEDTPEIAGPALEELASRVLAANSAEVEVVTGATWTSKGFIAALEAALAQAGLGDAQAAPVEETPAEPVVVSGSGLTVGLGIHNLGRIGPGKDDKEVQVYSFNQVFAGVLFDAEGKIVYATLDQLEVASPNYDGEGMPHFAGFPGQLPYLYDENHDGVIDGVLETNDELFQSDIAAWQTKRERGDGYRMGTGSWADQMNAYEAFFVGKTVDELDELFARVFSSRNGRPLKDGSTNEEDKAKYDALSEEDKALLADVVTGATMSLNDSHGNILAALRMAYDNRQPLAASATGVGLGMDFSGRIGPGKDNTDTQVYSINQVIALNLFDAEGKIVHSLVDQVEVATPNYDGAGMPHFSGFPGQGGYNYDMNHDGVVVGKFIPNNDGYLAEIAGWQTKRERGEDYRMGTGSWADQMDAYQAFFAGKTVDELDELFGRVFSSRNGRPLKDGSTNEEDKAKYDALSEEDKALLADVVTGATMSLNDSHGNILGALRDSLDKQAAVEVTLGE